VSNQPAWLRAARKRLRREITLLAWHAWQRLDAVLPRPVRFRLATALGELLYWLLARMRASTLANMRQVLGPDAPQEQVELMAKRSFRNYAKYLSEFTHLPRWSDDDLERLMSSVVGWQHVDDALADGKGAIFVSPHLGNWDVAGWYFGRRHAFSAVVEALQPPELDALVQGWRRAKYIGIIPLANAARGVLRALHHGEIVALVVDRPTHANGEGVQVRFFGAWTRVPAGAAHFAVKTGAPVIVAAGWRTPANTYVGIALPPLRFTSTGDRERDTAAAMQRIMADVETVIRAHPDQWYMFRRMWPERPAAQPAGHPVFGAVSPPLPSVSSEAAGS
jgi:KDO2-lipid IV(A) lauroyltransferase